MKKITTTKERNLFFENHVLEFFKDGYNSEIPEENLFCQVAYMAWNKASIRSIANDIVMGGSLLVYYSDIDDLRKENPGCIDGRLTSENAWNSYVRKCENAIIRIIKRFEVNPENINRLCVSCLSSMHIDHHASDLYIRKNDVSDFIIDRLNNKSLLSTFIDNIDHDTWYELPFCYMGIDKE